VKRQAGFYLYWRHILAAGDNHVIDAAGDEQVAIIVKKAGIAGEIPALPQRLGVGVGPAPIAFEGLVAGQERNNLALFAGHRGVIH
jgi:hypothetical protein